MYDFYNSIENFLFYSYDPYFRRIIGLRAKFWIQEGSKQVFWHTKIYIPVIRATIWKVQNGKKMSMVDYNNKMSIRSWKSYIVVSVHGPLFSDQCSVTYILVHYFSSVLTMILKQKLRRILPNFGFFFSSCNIIGYYILRCVSTMYLIPVLSCTTSDTQCSKSRAIILQKHSRQ